MTGEHVFLPSLFTFKPRPVAWIVESLPDALLAEVHPDVLQLLCAGHFPGEPIVPGAHLLAVMHDVCAVHIRQLRQGPRGLKPKPVRCRFRRVVHPKESLRIRIEAAANQMLRGSVFQGEERWLAQAQFELVESPSKGAHHA